MTAPTDRRYTVIVDGARPRTWGNYQTEAEAQAACSMLLRHGFVAHVVHDDDEQPEHRGDRRRFLVWAVLCGFAKPERLTERIVEEIESEVAP